MPVLQLARHLCIVNPAAVLPRCRHALHVLCNLLSLNALDSSQSADGRQDDAVCSCCHVLLPVHGSTLAQGAGQCHVICCVRHVRLRKHRAAPLRGEALQHVLSISQLLGKDCVLEDAGVRSKRFKTGRA